jgi:hypothetical protein
MIRAVPAALFVLLTVALAASRARAQSLVDEVSDDPCENARALDSADLSPEAQHLRRSCRLERLDARLSAERRQEIVAEAQVRDANIQQWLDRTQPPRVTRPMSIVGFAGTGLASYGLAYSWAFLRRWELGAWFGRRPISCLDANGNDDDDCSRLSYGLRFIGYIFDRGMSPFVGVGISFTTAHLQIADPASSSMPPALLIGSGRANSLSAIAGYQIAYRAFRASLEYVFEDAFYTGASLDDQKKSPNDPLRNALANSLRGDRNGIRFEVGFAF